VSLFSAILGSVFFFHPAIRLALKQLNLERELACDERVLVAGVRPAVYAEVILKVAEHAVSGQPSDCPAMNASRESLERRLNMILNHRPERVKNVWQLSVALRGAVVAAFAVMVLPQGTITAEMAIPTPIHPAAVIAPIPVPTPEVSAMPVQAAAPPAAAQSTTSQLSGTVYDQSGAVVPGVLITLTPSEGAAQTAITHEGGAYVFKSVGPGKYSLQARLPGFKTMQRDVQVSAGRQERADILLYIGALDTNVVVTATRPSPASASATPIRVGGDISAPNLISSPKPTYPPLARLAGIQGMVKLIGVIRTDGTVGSLSPESSAGGNPELIQAAMDAVKQWRYRPAMLNGVPIEVSTTIQVEFSLTD
jgi:TonB family protein